MYTDLKTVTSTSLILWVRLGVLTVEEFLLANQRNDYDDLVKLLNEKMDKLDFSLLQEKVKECIKE